MFPYPRLLLSGSAVQGQTTYLAPAILHQMEHLCVCTLDIVAMHNTNGIEDACIQVHPIQRGN